MKERHPESHERRDLAAQLAYQKRLNLIITRIHSARDTNDILLNLQGEILSLLDADRITVYAVDRRKKRRSSPGSRPATRSTRSGFRFIPAASPGYCAASGKVINVLDVYDAEELRRTIRSCASTRAGTAARATRPTRFSRCRSPTGSTSWGRSS